MKMTDWTREVLAYRREKRRMEAAGYKYHELDWRMHRGGLMDHVIADVKIDSVGTGVWYRLAKKDQS